MAGGVVTSLGAVGKLKGPPTMVTRRNNRGNDEEVDDEDEDESDDDYQRRVADKPPRYPDTQWPRV